MSKPAKKEDNQFQAHEPIEAHPYEGAYLLQKYAKELGLRPKGVARESMSILGPYTAPPHVMSIEIAPDTYESFIWGDFTLDTIDGRLTTSYVLENDENLKFCIAGTLSKLHSAWFQDFLVKFRAYVQANSLYKGKAVSLSTKGKRVDSMVVPKFINTSKVKPNEFILDTDLYEQIGHTIFTPIRNAEECRKLNIPLKRGILLEGPYGTGKTLTARATAKLCVDNGWTFFLVDNAKALPAAFTMAHRYSPAVIFAEDIDSSASGERTDAINDLLNTVDSIKSKTSEIMIVATTNHADTINEAMLRPGRIDSVVSFRNPSVETIKRLIEHYAGGLLANTEGLGTVAHTLAGCSPAFIREVVDRTKLRMLSSKANTFSCEDMQETFQGMRRHLEMATLKVTKKDKVNHLKAAVQEACGLPDDYDSFGN